MTFTAVVTIFIISQNNKAVSEVNWIADDTQTSRFCIGHVGLMFKVVINKDSDKQAGNIHL